MARLTWDSVQNPNFNGVADAYRNVSTLLGNAAQSGMNMLDTFRSTNTGAADRAILARLAGVTDPSQYNAGSIIGADGANASASVLQAVGNRPGTLLDWATSRNTLDQSQYTFGRTKEGNEILDNPVNRDAIARARTMALTDLPGAQRILGGLGLRTDQFASVFGDLEQSATGALNREISNQRLDESRYDFSRGKRNDRLTDELASARAFLSGNTVGPEQYERVLRNNGYSAETINALLGGAAGAAGPTGAIPSSGAAWASSVGLLSSESGGNYGASNNAVGSSGRAGHFGALQFGHDRLDDAKRAGVIPPDMTAEQFRTSGKEVQDRVADWHFADIDKQAADAGLERYYGQNIGGVQINRDAIRGMAHLGGMGGVKRFLESNGSQNPADANGTRLSDYGQRFGAPAARMDALLAQGQAALTGSAAQADITRAGGMANSGSLNQRLAAMEGQADVPLPQLTKGLSEGILKGYSEGEIAEEIRRVAAVGKMSKAQAAEVISENFVPRNDFIGIASGLQRTMNNVPLLNWIVPDAEVATNTFDRDINDAAARDYRGGGLATQDQNNRRTVAGQTLGMVQQQIATLDSQIQMAEQRYRATQSPMILEERDQLRARRLMLDPILNELLQMQQSDPITTTRDFAAEAKRRADLVAEGVSRGVNRTYPNNVAQQVAQAQADRFIPDFIP